MNLDWYSVERQALPAVLLGLERPAGLRQSDPFSVGSPDVVLGMTTNHGGGSGSLPALALLGTARKEVFSWVSTYAEGVFPLSQFCRVLAAEDWADVAFENPLSPAIGAVHPMWSSLVLGEMLGQVGAVPDLASIPLSRASACFSFAMARTALLYPQREGPRVKCAERLSLAEREPRFGRRNITTDMLRPVWSAAVALEQVPIDNLDFVPILLQALGGLNPEVLRLVRENVALLSDSAEERVTGFDSVADSWFDSRVTGSHERNSRAMALAAAALLAGRGTSHIQLLAPAAKDFPEVLVWYGLLAGLVGPRHWDRAWTQQAKGIERALRQFFRPDEPVQADICWVEYDWLARTYDSVEALTRLPRSLPSGLAIEIVPGVVCQFRLGEHGASLRTIVDPRTDTHELDVRRHSASPDTLSKALEMLAQVQLLLEGQNSKNVHQPGLFGAEHAPKPQKTKRTKGVTK